MSTSILCPHCWSLCRIRHKLRLNSPQTTFLRRATAQSLISLMPLSSSRCGWNLLNLHLLLRISCSLVVLSSMSADIQRHNHVFKVGVQFLDLGYYYPSTEKLHRSIWFGAVGYIITLYSSKSYVKSWGSVQILGRSGPGPPRLSSGCAHADM